jgi:hypothetical protein
MRGHLSRYARRVADGLIAATVVSLTLACERATPTPGRKDTAATVVPPPESSVVVAPPVSAWDSSAGPALFVVGQSPSEATVIDATYTEDASLDTARFDLARLRAVQVDLFAGGKQAGTARIDAITGPQRTDSCNGWPSARLSPMSADTAGFRGWSVAFEAGHATAVAFDSIDALAAGDSSRLAADIARIASSLPGDTAAVFRGLPFVVKKAWRSRGPGTQIVVAVVVRNVNQEANPRQERLLLIAERDTTASARYQPGYHERVTGLEEAIETTDPIAMILLGAERRPTVVVARDAGHGLSYALIERIGGRWQRRWASAYTGC